MKKIKYFFEFYHLIFFFIIYKILGLKISSYISGKLFEFLVLYLDQKNNQIKYTKSYSLEINSQKLMILKKICGIIMEEHYLNICFLKILEIINLNLILI